ncbi:MAG: DUF2283 domain-containing protein [Patescibacteria group bacterium]
MKASYDKEADILMLQLANKKIDDAYETENMIVHIAKDGEVVLLDIFNASRLIKSINKALPKKLKEEILASA